MTIDLALLGLVALFALLGAVTGAAKQVANVVSLICGWLFARPLGAGIGPRLAPDLGVPVSVAIIGATVLAFGVIVIAVRVLLTPFLRRILDAADPESRTVDRSLGFVLGGLKVALLAWVFLCALSFVEENVTVAGRRLGISPRGSLAFKWARTFNLFELTQFSGVKDLAKVAAAATDPKKAGALKSDPAYQRLARDPRFRKLLDQRGTRAALERGDYRALLKNNLVLQLLQDDAFADQLSAASGTLEGGP